MKSKAETVKVDLRLTRRFTKAVEYVRQIHTENRKETKIPYLAHLIGTASIVMGENGYLDFPVTEDMVIAALLHDVVEDHGGLERLGDVKSKFGRDVAEMVKGCTDSFAKSKQGKAPWKQRKCAYLKKLAGESAPTRLISAADKLYNARAILDDYRKDKDQLWSRFNRGRDDQLWYYKECVKVFTAAGTNRIVAELKRVVKTLEAISAS